MKYNLENYEEIALDYLENNLNEIDREQFELFLEKHPEIKRIFENFELITLPEFDVEFPSKEKLLKYENNKRFNLYTYWMRVAAVIFLPLLFFVLAKSYSKINSEPSPEDHVLNELPLTQPVESTPEMAGQHSEVNLNGELPDQKMKLLKQNINREEVEIKSILNYSIPELTEITVNEETLLEERILTPPLQRLDDRTFTLASTAGLDIAPFNEILYPIEKEVDGWNKLGKFLAKSNLMPLGLEEEWASIRIKERILPESLMTNAN